LEGWLIGDYEWRKTCAAHEYTQHFVMRSKVKKPRKDC
jgi:hypothetical protein